MLTRTVRGPLPEYGYTAEVAGMRRGVALVQGTSNTQAKLATAIGQGAYRGIQIDEGSLPNGAANYGQDASHPAEQVNCQKDGIAWALAAASQTVTMGGQAICNASGQFITRTPYSFSAFVYGQYDETRTVGSNAEFVGVELLPQYVETVRNVSDFCATVGAITKYMNYGQAVSTSAVPKFVCSYTGQKICNLAIDMGTAPAGTDSVKVTVYKSATGAFSFAATALTCTATGTAKSAYDLSNIVTLTKGDVLAIYVEATGTTAANLAVSFDVV